LYKYIKGIFIYKYFSNKEKSKTTLRNNFILKVKEGFDHKKSEKK
jgi:hypothetical protein